MNLLTQEIYARFSNKLVIRKIILRFFGSLLGFPLLDIVLEESSQHPMMLSLAPSVRTTLEKVGIMVGGVLAGGVGLEVKQTKFVEFTADFRNGNYRTKVDDNISAYERTSGVEGQSWSAADKKQFHQNVLDIRKEATSGGLTTKAVVSVTNGSVLKAAIEYFKGRGK